MARTVGVRLVFGHDALTAVRAGVVLGKPGFDAFCVKPVAAREHSDGLADINFIHADGTLGFAIVCKVGDLNRSCWQ